MEYLHITEVSRIENWKEFSKQVAHCKYIGKGTMQILSTRYFPNNPHSLKQRIWCFFKNIGFYYWQWRK